MSIKFLHFITNKVISVLFSSSCLSCSTSVTQHNELCVDCWGDIKFLGTNICNKCGALLDYISHNDINLCNICSSSKSIFDLKRSVCLFEGDIRKLIHRFKYCDQIYLKKFFVPLMIKQIISFKDQIDFIIPIPLHVKKLRKRMYNQAAILSNDIAKKLEVESINNVLIRGKNTVAQIELDKKARMLNMRNAFLINQKNASLIKNKNILLIDDTITTGVTISEASKTLRKANVNKIFVLSFSCTNVNTQENCEL